MTDPKNLTCLRIETLHDLHKQHQDEHLLVGFRFGQSQQHSQHPAIVDLALPPLTDDHLIEAWWYQGPVHYRQHGRARIAECADFAVVTVEFPDAGTNDFQQLTLEAYRELLSAIEATGQPHMIKIWNYFDQINRGDGDEEKYRRFSVGRAVAFDEFHISDDELPTGTAIGSHGGQKLCLVALISNHTLHRFENPRQVSAYQYPVKYGPKSPKFSRAGVVSMGRQKLFMLSGTASVVGHESAHPNDIGSQTAETFLNLKYLSQTATSLAVSQPDADWEQSSVLRVYLRQAEDLPFVLHQFHEVLGRDTTNVSFLLGDICRDELMIEIDGLKLT